MPEVEIESILTELREKARKDGPQKVSRQPVDRQPLASSAVDLTILSRYDILETPFTSHRKILGKTIIFIKNFARELLIQIFARQVAYNEANTQVATALTRTTEHLSYAQTELSRQLASTHVDLTEQLKSTRLDLERNERSVNELESRIINEYMAALRSEMAEYMAALRSEMAEYMAAPRSEMAEYMAALRSEMAEYMVALRSEMADDRKSIDELRSIATRIPPGIPTQDQVHELKRMVLDQQRRIAILLEEGRRSPPEDNSKEKPSRIIEERDHLLDTFYLMLEDQFRGTREEIKQRLQVYLPHVKDFKSEGAKVLDIGCGRGEFLELLRDQGVGAEGVDYNRAFVEQCRELGFEVAEADALTFLRECKSNTYSAVSAIHVVEHLPFHVLIALLDEVLRVLRPGGLAILETPNPENILVGSNNFYIDPTHRKPLPSPLLSFLAEKRGFCQVKVLKLHPCPNDVRLEGSAVADRLNEILYGPQDYAVLGYKV